MGELGDHVVVERLDDARPEQRARSRCSRPTQVGHTVHVDRLSDRSADRDVVGIAVHLSVDEDLDLALKQTVPLYRTYEEKIKWLRDWAKTRARPATFARTLFSPI